MTDIRKEQLALLRFEKQLAGLAGSLVACGAAAQIMDGKLAVAGGAEAVRNMQDALVHLASVTSEAHEALNAQAAASGAQLLQATGGIPKVEVSKVVASILGIG